MNRLVYAGHPAVKDVLEYLEEKLSPGQIGVYASHRQNTFCSNYQIGKLGGRDKTFWFQLENVPEKYWSMVVHPGLKHLAYRLNKLIIFPPQRLEADIIEFCF